MKLYFKQRLFSWFDSYDIYDYDTGDVVYTVEGQLAWGHCLHRRKRRTAGSARSWTLAPPW